MVTDKKLLFVQFGDFQEASARLAKGEPETYYGQDHSVAFVEDLARQVTATKIIGLDSEPTRQHSLPAGITVEGLRYYQNKRVNEKILLQKIKAFSPTEIILRTPLIPVLEFAVMNTIRILPLFADSFVVGGGSFLPRMRQRWRNRRLARVLNAKAIEIVANHNIPACLSLWQIGVEIDKIIPWDWPPLPESARCPAKQMASGRIFRLLYAGMIDRRKGVTDLVEAVARLHRQGLAVELTLVGPGATNEIVEQARQAGISNSIHLLGRLSNSAVRRLMRDSDIVVVPSRHCYPEGLPLTIYEALAAATPLIVSDHPMFAGKLKDGEQALFFRAEDPVDLAEKIAMLLHNPEMYWRLSNQSSACYRQLFVPTEWSALIHDWLFYPRLDSTWLDQRNLRYLLAKDA